MKEHSYRVQVLWTGNEGKGTASYQGYSRDHVISADGKPAIACSSDPSFRGDPSRYNPEELLVASLSSCHMLWYLHLCAVSGVSVVGYRDSATGVMDEGADGSGEFTLVTLRPTVEIVAGNDPMRALAMHAEAHKLCYIARSVKFPVDIVTEIREVATVVLA